jgi:hypothetical protein
VTDTGHIDTHRTPIRFPSIVAVGAFAAFCLWLGGETVTMRRDISDLKAKHVLTDEEINEKVRKRVEELWSQKRPAIRLQCDQFPQRGVYGGCREIVP